MRGRALTGRGLAAALLLAGGALLIAQGGWIQLKAALAQVLLERAWAMTLEDGRQHRPWPWADHWPVARLHYRNTTLIVLSGDSGHVLAFAPGHSPRSGLPGSGLTTVISGHRDTHFADLDRLLPGDRIQLETPRGRFRYTVTGSEVADARRAALALRPDAALRLVTCWPLRALSAGGDQRYVVLAEAANAGPPWRPPKPLH